jgi:citronellol/citronellal dehydrogenase
MAPLTGKTIFISGASRGIGLAIAKKVARDGANVAFIAKTAEPHPALPGTVYTAAAEIEEAGGRALPIVGDIRNEDQVVAAVESTVELFGGIDFCVNNASAINLSNTESLPMKRYDLMQGINTRGTFLVSKACIPYLKESDNAHILTLSPPLNLAPHWFKNHVAYTIAKYGMSMVTLGLSQELADEAIAANCLWPKTIIATAAVQNLLGGDQAMARSRRPEIVADAAYEIFQKDARTATGNFYIDEEVLTEAGVTNFERYGYGTEGSLQLDIFLDE